MQKYEGRPFALLGVDLDESRETLQRAQKKHHLNWRSWWDGNGVISLRWRVEGLPTLFLIDHKGNVRWQLVGAPSDTRQLDDLIEQLVKKAESEGDKQASLLR